MSEIFPRALVTAAKTFAKKPAVVGEVLVALVAADGAGAAKLSEVQRYIFEACREEIAEQAARRERASERKRRQRNRAMSGAEQHGDREKQQAHDNKKKGDREKQQAHDNKKKGGK